MTRTRKAKGRDDLVRLLRMAHRTEIREVTEKVVMTEAQKAHQNLLVKVRQGKRTYYLDWHVPECQVDADSETRVHTNTQQNLLMKRTIQHRLLFMFHRMMDKCNNGKFCRMTRPNTDLRVSLFSYIVSCARFVRR